MPIMILFILPQTDLTYSPMKEIIVTDDNLSDLVYEVREGIKYQFTNDCVRVMKRPFVDTEREVSKILNREKVDEMDVESDRYWINVRLDAILVATEGDDIPDGGWTINMLNTVVSDFFRWRYVKAAPQIDLLAQTNTTQG